MRRVRAAIRHAGAAGLVLIGAVLLVGSTASVQGARTLAASSHLQAASTLDGRAALAEAAVDTEVHRYLDALRTVAGALGGYDDLTYDQFQATTAPLRDAGLVGASSVVMVVSVADGDVSATEAYWRQRGAPELEFKAQGTGHEHLLTVFARPLDAQPSSAPGMDVSQSAEPTAALNESRRSGEPSVSDAYVLLRDRGLRIEEQQLSFILTAPVYGLPDVAGQRAFRGWVLMGLRGHDFIGGVLDEAAQGLVGASLWATNGGGQQVRVARLDLNAEPDLRREVSITVANRQWRLEITASYGTLKGNAAKLPVTIAVAGCAVTVLLAGLVWVLIGARARARAKVDEATAELRQAQSAAARQVALLNGVLERISDGVSVVDEHGEFLVHNPAAKTMLGMDETFAGPAGWQEQYGIFRPDGITPFPTDELPLVRALDGEVTDGVEMVIRNAGKPDGALLSVSGRPLDASGQRGAIAVFHDITAVREREADLAAFAGIVAHDLKNPLAVIAAHAQLAADSLTDLAADSLTDLVRAEQSESVRYAKESLERINGGVVRMRRLIDDLLAYTTARDAQLRLHHVDLYALVSEVVDEAINHLSDGEHPPDVYVGRLPYVQADPGMLRHVLDNLIGNALKYVAPGRAAKIDISAAPAQAGWVHVEVADRGIGIPDADKSHVFESFHRAHGSTHYGGTGLGLAICRRIIDRHGGMIGVADNPGGGTRFWFKLAVVSPTVAASPAVRSEISDHEYV